MSSESRKETVWKTISISISTMFAETQIFNSYAMVSATFYITSLNKKRLKICSTTTFRTGMAWSRVFSWISIFFYKIMMLVSVFEAWQRTHMYSTSSYRPITWRDDMESQWINGNLGHSLFALKADWKVLVTCLLC